MVNEQAYRYPALSEMVESEVPVIFNEEKSFSEPEMRVVLMLGHEHLAELDQVSILTTRKKRVHEFIRILKERNSFVSASG